MKTIAVISQKKGQERQNDAGHPPAALASESNKVILMDLDPLGSAIERASCGDRSPRHHGRTGVPDRWPAGSHACQPTERLCKRANTQTGVLAHVKTIAVISQKGGNGKTTLAIHLAALASESNKVILMDLDPQGSAIEWASRRGDRPPDITPAHPAALAKEIERAGEEGYTFAVIDTAPHADHAALQAARSADLVVIPCRPATFDIAAIGATLDLCKLANKQAIVVLNSAPIRSRVVDEAIEAIE